MGRTRTTTYNRKGHGLGGAKNTRPPPRRLAGQAYIRTLLTFNTSGRT